MPSFSPDGKHIAFAQRGAIWIARLPSGTAKRLAGPPATRDAVYRPVWAPDSRHIAFVSYRTGCPTTDVWVYSADTKSGQVTRYPNRQPGTNRPHATIKVVPMAWRPNAHSVYYIERRYSWGDCRYFDLESTRLLRVAPDQRSPKVVFAAPELGRAVLSPKGTQIAFSSGNGDECSLRVFETTSRRIRRIATIPYLSYPDVCWGGGLSFAWSRSGDELFYANGKNVLAASLASGRQRIVKKGPAGPVDCNVTSFCVWNQILSVSGDGRWLLVVEGREDRDNEQSRSKVWLVRSDGSTSRLIEAPAGEKNRAPLTGWVSQ